MAEKGSGKAVTDGKQEKERKAAEGAPLEREGTPADAAGQEGSIMAARQESGKKFKVGKLRENCMQLYHITASTFDGAFYGHTEKEMSIQEAGAVIRGWLGKGR
ncbi:MAG: hypothetical protein HFH38_00815 [Lachnospiraceae bacterium]|jgi:hypothetical protein|nr:hypothetical protein [Lachnospiraceae bacterium]